MDEPDFSAKILAAQPAVQGLEGRAIQLQRENTIIVKEKECKRLFSHLRIYYCKYIFCQNWEFVPPVAEPSCSNCGSR